MRVVTNAQMQRFERARAAVSEMAARGHAAANAAAAAVITGRRADYRVTAAGVEPKATARARLAMADAGAELEIAAVGFLGERRWPGESLTDYLERISGLCADLSAILATQRANGLEYRL